MSKISLLRTHNESVWILFSEDEVTKDATLSEERKDTMATEHKSISFALKSITDSQLEVEVIPSILTASLQVKDDEESNTHDSDGSSVKPPTPLRLDLSCNAISAKGALRLTQDLSKPALNVAVLDLSANMLQDDGAKVIASFLMEDRKLMFVDLHANRITDIGAVKFVECLDKNTTLKAFDLSANDLTDEMLGVIEASAKRNSKVSLSGENRMQEFESVCAIC